MKQITSLMLLLPLAALYSCSGNSNENKAAADGADTVFQTENYRAIDGKDTALLTLKISDKKVGKNVTGDLIMNLDTKDDNQGTIEGNFSGDTLFVDYVHTVGKEQTSRRNPLAFLKKDNELILGVGKIETVLGRSFISKKEPVNFEQGRFIFEKVTEK